MKLKKKHLTWGIVAGIALIIVILFLLNLLSTPKVYENVNSPRPILGNPDANVKVIEYSDLQCPACKLVAAYPKRLLNDFGGNISIEYRHFPLSFHQYAYKAAIGAECANDQGKFWEFVDNTYDKQPELTVGDLKKYVKDLGLNTTAFNVCLDTEAKKDIVDKHIREGYALNIPGTPTFFVNGLMLTTITYDDVKSAVEEEFNK